MDKGKNYEVKDINLVEQGIKNIEWAEMQMKSLLKVRERFKKEKPLKEIYGQKLRKTIGRGTTVNNRKNSSRIQKTNRRYFSDIPSELPVPGARPDRFNSGSTDVAVIVVINVVSLSTT